MEKKMKQDEAFAFGVNYVNSYFEVVKLEIIMHLMFNSNQLALLNKMFKPVLTPEKKALE